MTAHFSFGSGNFIVTDLAGSTGSMLCQLIWQVSADGAETRVTNAGKVEDRFSLAFAAYLAICGEIVKEAA